MLSITLAVIGFAVSVWIVIGVVVGVCICDDVPVSDRIVFGALFGVPCLASLFYWSVIEPAWSVVADWWRRAGRERLAAILEVLT